MEYFCNTYSVLLPNWAGGSLGNPLEDEDEDGVDLVTLSEEEAGFINSSTTSCG